MRADAAATIFSRSSAPPPPLIRLRSGAISSAPSTVRSSSGVSSSVVSGMPSRSASRRVASEVGTRDDVEAGAHALAEQLDEMAARSSRCRARAACRGARSRLRGQRRHVSGPRCPLSRRPVRRDLTNRKPLSNALRQASLVAFVRGFGQRTPCHRGRRPLAIPDHGCPHRRLRSRRHAGRHRARPGRDPQRRSSRARGLPPVAYDAARNMVGGGARADDRARACGRSAQACRPPKSTGCSRDFIEHYAAHIADRSAAVSRPGARRSTTLAARGCRFAVCTNKLEWLSVLLLDALGLSQRFEAICGADTFGVQKPDPEPLRRTIERLPGPARRCRHGRRFRQRHQHRPGGRYPGGRGRLRLQRDPGRRARARPGDRDRSPTCRRRSSTSSGGSPNPVDAGTVKPQFTL